MLTDLKSQPLQTAAIVPFHLPSCSYALWGDYTCPGTPEPDSPTGQEGIPEMFPEVPAPAGLTHACEQFCLVSHLFPFHNEVKLYEIHY